MHFSFLLIPRNKVNLTPFNKHPNRTLTIRFNGFMNSGSFLQVNAQIK
jgi:hypothetical protein